MSGAKPFLITQPLRYAAWSARERPALFWAVSFALAGPVILLTVPPIRRHYGYERPAPIPRTYPIPEGPRKTLKGYED